MPPPRPANLTFDRRTSKHIAMHSAADPFDRTWISIVHWNGGEATLHCIESVVVDHPAERIVFVDNGSTDGIVAIVRARWPMVSCLVNADNCGFTGGHNQAMRHAFSRGAAFVMLLNQDARLRTGCVRALLEIASSDARIGLLSPVVYYADEPSRVQFCGTTIDFDLVKIGGTRNLDEARAIQDSPGATICLWGTALLLRRELVDDIGMLDDRLFAYFEDTDLSVRAIRAGWRTRVVFGAGIDHEGHATRYQRGPHVFYLSSRNSLLFWKKAMARRRDQWRAHRKAVASILHEAGTLQDANLPEQAHACIDGLWAGWRRHYGSYANRVTAPAWVSRILLRHPYLWWRLFDGEVRAVAYDALRRVGIR